MPSSRPSNLHHRADPIRHARLHKIATIWRSSTLSTTLIIFGITDSHHGVSGSDEGGESRWKCASNAWKSLIFPSNSSALLLVVIAPTGERFPDWKKCHVSGVQHSKLGFIGRKTGWFDIIHRTQSPCQEESRHKKHVVRAVCSMRETCRLASLLQLLFGTREFLVEVVKVMFSSSMI